MTPAPAQATKLPEPERFLQLTTPAIHGEDVGILQTSLRTTHNQHYVRTDKQYGPLTKHAVGVVANAMGLEVYVATPYVQKIIEGIEKRTPVQVLRAKQRAAAAAKAGHGLAGVLSHGLTHVGVEESPSGSNEGTPYPSGWEKNFGMNGVSWCGCFAGSMILDAGGHVTDRVAYVPYIVADARAGQDGFSRFVAWNSIGRDQRVKPGWLVTYDWNGNHSFGMHVGIVKELTSDGVIACEGNTESGNAGDQSDGGGVFVRTRSNVDIIGYCCPLFP